MVMIQNQDAVSVEVRTVTAQFTKPEFAHYFVEQLQKSLGYAKSVRVWKEMPGEHRVEVVFETRTRSTVMVQHLPLPDREGTLCSQRYDSEDPDLPVFVHYPKGTVPLCNSCERWSEAGSSAP